MRDLISKADVLLEALPYIQRFRSQTFVVKYGGSFMDSPDPDVRDGVARDVVFLEAVGINPVVVHGGGKAITRAMDAAGLKADFIQGMRVTDEAAVNVVERGRTVPVPLETVVGAGATMEMVKSARSVPTTSVVGVEMFVAGKTPTSGALRLFAASIPRMPI